MDSSKNFVRQIFKTMKMIHKKIIIIFSENDLHITPQQYFVMKMIASEKSIIQQHLAQTLKSDKSSMLRQLDKLEKEMLVARMPDGNDRRKKILVLTACGAELLEKGKTLEHKLLNNLNNNIEEEEMETFLKVLNQLRINTELE